MAKLVAIHGIGQQFKGAAMLRQEWLAPVCDGLSLAGHPGLSEADLECVFYGELFRPSGKANVDPPLDASDVATDWEQAVLAEWWAESARIDTGVASPSSASKVRTPVVVQRALNALSTSRFFAGIAENALVFDLKQVYRYLHDPALRRAIRDRACSAIRRDTRVVVGHSLGSVVAYEALCALGGGPRVCFVSLGSPLGIRNLIFDRLEPAPVAGRGDWPSCVERWVNVADRGDVVALAKTLASRFGPGVRDVSIDNGARAHDATRYLNARETGEAIGAGLHP